MSFTLNSDGVKLTGAATGDAGQAIEYNFGGLGSRMTAVEIGKAGLTGCTFTGAVVAPSFSGSGAGLTGLSASNVSTGTLNASRLPTTLNATTFSGTVSLGTNTLVAGIGDFSGVLQAGFGGSAHVQIGLLPGDSTYGGVWVGQASPSSSNYSFMARNDGAFTLFNANSGVIDFRLANATKLEIGSSYIQCQTNFLLPTGLINTATTGGTWAGQVVFDTSGGANNNHFMGWNGSAWKQLDN